MNSHNQYFSNLFYSPIPETGVYVRERKRRKQTITTRCLHEEGTVATRFNLMPDCAVWKGLRLANYVTSTGRSEAKAAASKWLRGLYKQFYGDRQIRSHNNGCLLRYTRSIFPRKQWLIADVCRDGRHCWLTLIVMLDNLGVRLKSIP